MEKNVQPRELKLRPDVDIPNNPVLPVLIYKAVLNGRHAEKDRIFQQAFERSGWAGIWKNGIHDYHHFHPDAHEALGIASGHVTVRLGGESGKTIKLEAGDLVVLPAGTGHRRLEASENLIVIGAYPPGQENNETCCAMNACKASVQDTGRVPVPLADPFYGAGGPLPGLWQAHRSKFSAMKG